MHVFQDPRLVAIISRYALQTSDSIFGCDVHVLKRIAFGLVHPHCMALEQATMVLPNKSYVVNSDSDPWPEVQPHQYKEWRFTMPSSMAKTLPIAQFLVHVEIGVGYNVSECDLRGCISLRTAYLSRRGHGLNNTITVFWPSQRLEHVELMGLQYTLPTCCTSLRIEYPGVTVTIPNDATYQTLDVEAGSLVLPPVMATLEHLKFAVRAEHRALAILVWDQLPVLHSFTCDSAKWYPYPNYAPRLESVDLSCTSEDTSPPPFPSTLRSIALTIFGSDMGFMDTLPQGLKRLRITSRVQKSIHLDLAQYHLPQIEDLGVISFGKHDGAMTVALDPRQTAQLRRFKTSMTVALDPRQTAQLRRFETWRVVVTTPVVFPRWMCELRLGGDLIYIRQAPQVVHVFSSTGPFETPSQLDPLHRVGTAHITMPEAMCVPFTANILHIWGSCPMTDPLLAQRIRIMNPYAVTFTSRSGVEIPRGQCYMISDFSKPWHYVPLDGLYGFDDVQWNNTLGATFYVGSGQQFPQHAPVCKLITTSSAARIQLSQVSIA